MQNKRLFFKTSLLISLTLGLFTIASTSIAAPASGAVAHKFCLSCYDDSAACSFDGQYISEGSDYGGAIEEPECVHLEGGCQSLNGCEKLAGIDASLIDRLATENEISQLSDLMRKDSRVKLSLTRSRVEVRDCDDRVAVAVGLSGQQLAQLSRSVGKANVDAH